MNQELCIAFRIASGICSVKIGMIAIDERYYQRSVVPDSSWRYVYSREFVFGVFISSDNRYDRISWAVLPEGGSTGFYMVVRYFQKGCFCCFFNLWKSVVPIKPSSPTA